MYKLALNAGAIGGKLLGAGGGGFYIFYTPPSSKHELIEFLNESNNQVGKKMNFLLQEMGREVNTIGSKTDLTKVSHIVVNLKNEIEKIREQVQNIL